MLITKVSLSCQDHNQPFGSSQVRYQVVSWFHILMSPDQVLGFRVPQLVIFCLTYVIQLARPVCQRLGAVRELGPTFADPDAPLSPTALTESVSLSLGQFHMFLHMCFVYFPNLLLWKVQLECLLIIPRILTMSLSTS